MTAITLPPIWALRCLDIDGRLICTRAEGHEGRHAATLVGGKVVRVWGEDVHAETRAQARRTALVKQLHADGTLARLAPRKVIGGAS